MSAAVLRVVVGGGGVSGLATAYRLLAAGRTGDGRRVELTLLEGSARLGGNIRTDQHDGFVIDGGPDAWVNAKPAATALAKELGLADRLIGTTPVNRRVLVLDRGKLHPFPEGMLLTVPTQVLPFLETGLLSPFGKLRAGLDLLLPRRTSPADESIADLVRRRFGREVLQKLGGPLLGGVFAGDVETLSVRATFPQLADLERRHRSLILGARAELAERAAARKPGGPPPSVFSSFPGGLAEFVDALATRVTELGGTIVTGARITRVEERAADPAPPPSAAAPPPSGRFRIHAELNGEPTVLTADSVVLAMPGYAAAAAVRDLDREMAETLRDVPYVSSVVVGLAYPRANVEHPLDATGVLSTDRDGQVLAVTFLSSKWAGRAPDDSALFRVFMGGAGHEEALAMSDATLVSTADRALASLVGIRGEPLFARIYRHERASAQPVLGHETRVRRVREREARHPGLFVVGAAMDGVGIPDCVRQATDLASRLLAQQ